MNALATSAQRKKCRKKSSTPTHLVGGPTRGPSGWAQARNFGTQKNQKHTNSQNQNPFCPKCRQGFLMPEKGVPAPFGALPAHFLRGPEKSKNCTNFAYFPWWAHGPYSPGLGPHREFMCSFICFGAPTLKFSWLHQRHRCLQQKHQSPSLFYQGRPGTARIGGPAALWHGKILARKILARHGTENIGTEK